VSGGEEVAGDGCAHFAEAEEGDVHVCGSQVSV
jgi:hypothetical protein